MDSRGRVIEVLALLLSLFLVAFAQNSCAHFNRDCQACIAKNGCGYCESTGLCIEGTKTSPFNETLCPLKYWNPCLKACASRDICYDCISAQCGWCKVSENESKCLLGNHKGPMSGSCLLWQYGELSKCSYKPPCSDRKGCNNCLTDESCGWCETTSQCLDGKNAGPTEGSCERWSFMTCPVMSHEGWWVWVVVGSIAALFMITCIGLFIRRWNSKKREEKYKDDSQFIITNSFEPTVDIGYIE